MLSEGNVPAARSDADAPQGASVGLADRIRQGDKTAEAQFVREYEPGIRALVRRHTRPGEAMVDDFVQEVLAAALERLRKDELRDPQALPAYLRTMIVHITAAEYRRRASRGETVSTEQLERLPAREDPAEALRTQQLARHVRTLLAELPVQRDRELLLRFYLEEHSKEDVCSDLAIAAEHFHRVVFRARERLRELLLDAGIEPST